MYRFLLTPRWMGGAALTIVAAALMVLLGNWQYDRYLERDGINTRIDAGQAAPPAAVASVLPRPAGPTGAGPAPPADAAWTPVTATGRFDTGNEVLVRARPLHGRVGYEVVTPLLLPDGTALLVDRGWVPPAPGAALATPTVPPAPVGEVTVVGRVHLSESRGVMVDRRDGRLQTRRIDVARIATELPYPVYGAYVLLTEQRPPAAAGLEPIPVAHERAWQNGGYAAQWWLFAAMAFAAYGWLAYRQAHPRRPGDADTDRAAVPDRTNEVRA